MSQVAAAAGTATRSRARRVRVPLIIVLAFVFVAGVVLFAVVGTTFIFQSPSAIDPLSVAARPSSAHLLGTDELGRDVLARVVAGCRSALIGPLIIAVSGFVVSGIVGIGAGYVGGLLDAVVMRCVDFLFALPGLLIAIVIVTIVQGGYWVAVIVLAVLNVTGDIRLVRGATLAQRSLAYVEAERSAASRRGASCTATSGATSCRSCSPTSRWTSASALVALAGLAFLGLASQPGRRTGA